mgnify:CR=1 FL=1|tara:strand:+ start:5393 stop:5587 length:195 start_codon:yes stop_codon:yes gene_type:complete
MITGNKSLNKLCDIYVRWIEKNKIDNEFNASADEVLYGTPNLTVEQKNWLARFIDVWDKMERKA